MNMELTVTTSSGVQVKTTRCPISVDGKFLAAEKGAPRLGEHNEAIEEEFELLKEMAVAAKKNK